jgi:hypothetical protein
MYLQIAVFFDIVCFVGILLCSPVIFDFIQYDSECLTSRKNIFSFFYRSSVGKKDN